MAFRQNLGYFLLIWLIFIMIHEIDIIKLPFDLSGFLVLICYEQTLNKVYWTKIATYACALRRFSLHFHTANQWND